MAGLKAMFSLNQVRDYMQDQIDNAKAKTIEALKYAGEEFVNKARATKTYVDDTGNLRASIGYVILDDGHIIDRNFKAANQGDEDGKDGVTAGLNFVDEVSSQYPKGLVLIGVAGMSYAAAVESLGYDVITGSAPNDNDIKDLLGAIKL